MSLKIKGHFKGVGKPRFWGDDNANYATKFWLDIEKDSDHPQIGEFEVYKDKVDLSKFEAGDLIEVSFNIKGRKGEWTDKNSGKEKSAIFSSLDAWKIEKVGAAPSPPTKANDEPDDDLPF